MNIEPIDLNSLNISKLAVGVLRSLTDVDDFNYLARGLATLPIPLQGRMARKYIDRYNSKDQKSRYKANQWIGRTINRLKPRFGVLFSITQNMPLPWHILSSAEKTKEHASNIAANAAQIMTDLADEHPQATYEELIYIIFYQLIEFADGYKVQAPHKNVPRNNLTTDLVEIALLKLKCEKWWARKLKGVRRQYIELLEIATGQVGKDLFYDYKNGKPKRRGISPYSSKSAQREYAAAQETGIEFLKMMELEGSDGSVIDLIKAVKKGMANPVNRRNELMLRIRETEELADEMGFVGVFYTLTAPAKYHANSKNWQGSTPKQTQQYFNETWAKARAKLNRLGITYFGVRVAEPHADGTPHWHMMLFMPKHQMQTLNAILRWYFIQEDKHELYERRTRRTELFKLYKQKRKEYGFLKSKGKKPKEPNKFFRTFSPRFEVVIIDKRKGSAASYIAKYISKNIDGYKLLDHLDDETGEGFAKFDENGKVIKNNINPVLAWASTWRIRQFQFLGSPSVTVYRELRRIRTQTNNEHIEPIRQAADEARWKDYVKLQGGMCIGREANFKTHYEITKLGNDYAETVKQIKGVVHVLSNSTLKTRLVEWQRQLKGTAAKNAQADTANVGSADISWTSGNNCTPCTTRYSDEFLLDMHGFTEQELKEVKKDLLSGKKIKRNDLIYQIRQGQLIVFDHQAQIKERKREYTEHLAHSLAQKQADAERYQAQQTAKANWDVLNDEQLAELQHKGHVLVGRRVYHMQDGKLTSFKKVEFNDLEQFIPAEPTKEHWSHAREVVELAFSYANQSQRELPNNSKFNKNIELIGDLELAELVISGKASTIDQDDWWGVRLMA